MTIAISFFSGAGGLDIGIKKSGFDIKLAVEIEKTFCETLKSNFPSLNVKQGNIMEYTKERVFSEANLSQEIDIDLIFGGSPCQSFSTAGKRTAFSDSRGKAMLKFANLINGIKPKFFLLENVRGLLSSAIKHRPINQRGNGFPPLEEQEQPGSALRFLLKQFGSYNINYQLLNSANYGVPQKRERVFIIGVRKDLDIKYIFPEPTHSNTGKDNKPWKIVKQVLKNINVKQHNYVKYSKDRLKYMKLIPEGGGNWRNLPESIKKEAMGGAYHSGGGKVGFFRRINVNKPSPTLLTVPIQKSTNLGHPYENRPLSIEEYLSIQEFPNEYIVCGTLQQQYTQIGNAVPVRLAYTLGKSIMNSLYSLQKV